jgi:hypothetical protein
MNDVRDARCRWSGVRSQPRWPVATAECRELFSISNALSDELVVQLREAVNALARSRAPDWHPGTNDIVNDLIHPSLYALRLPTEIAVGSGRDFWNRPYESTRYQWLPSDVRVDADGHCHFASYINNMPEEFVPSLTPLLERVLDTALPFVENIWQYAKTMDLRFNAMAPQEPGADIVDRPLGDEDMFEEYDDSPSYTVAERVRFRNCTLQVVPKIAEFVFTPGARFGGVWHYEGMPHENIVATVLYFLRRDEVSRVASCCG